MYVYMYIHVYMYFRLTDGLCTHTHAHAGDLIDYVQ